MKNTKTYKRTLSFLRYIILCYLIFGASINGIAQEYAPIEDVDILAEHKKVLKNEYPHIFDTLLIECICKIDDKHSMISFLKDSIYHEVIVNSAKTDLLLVATVQEIYINNVPGPVMAAFLAEKEKGWEIIKPFKVKTPYSSWFYAIDMKKDDKTKRKFFDEFGSYKKSPY